MKSDKQLQLLMRGKPSRGCLHKNHSPGGGDPGLYEVYYAIFLSSNLFVIYLMLKLLLQCCCNLSGGVALIVWFTTNGCARRTKIYMRDASKQ